MPEELPLRDAPLVRYYGTFNLKQLLTDIRGFFTDEGFDDIKEKSYKHKVGSEGVELEVKMESDRKLNEYVKYEFKIELRLSDMKDVEVSKDGEKLKMQHGRVQSKVEGMAYLDYQEHFESNNFLKALRDFYHKMIIKSKTEEAEEYVHFKALKLQDTVKRSLGSEVHG